MDVSWKNRKRSRKMNKSRKTRSRKKKNRLKGPATFSSFSIKPATPYLKPTYERAYYSSAA